MKIRCVWYDLVIIDFLFSLKNLEGGTDAGSKVKHAIAAVGFGGFPLFHSKDEPENRRLHIKRGTQADMLSCYTEVLIARCSSVVLQRARRATQRSEKWTFEKTKHFKRTAIFGLRMEASHEFPF